MHDLYHLPPLLLTSFDRPFPYTALAEGICRAFYIRVGHADFGIFGSFEPEGRLLLGVVAEERLAFETIGRHCVF